MAPKTAPLKSLTAVLSWNSLDVADDPTARVFLSKHVKSRPVPQTLVCHDMKGGYLEDRFIQGSTNHKAYRFFHWQLIDSFVYFSHHFCTIPPACWIDAAHKHDVQMLGTIITEWDDGKETCKTFLCEDVRDVLVRKLVDIAVFYRFDGWLINIENTIEVDQVGSLKRFVHSLRNLMHEEIAHSQVLWYDSVTHTGKLAWQDQLNDNNSDFFNSCDGIFLNYGWNEEKLKTSGEVADVTGRRTDIYVGVDVFGRGCPGGGGYNTKEALALIRKENLSAAIFAPGWVHETQDINEFTNNQNKFWNELQCFCSPHPISYLPLVTSFCQGYGSKYFLHGQLVDSSPWFNLSLQQVQPCLFDSEESSLTKFRVYEEEAYLGGTCLCFQGQFSDTTRNLCFKVLEMEVELHQTVLISYTYRQLTGPHCKLAVCLTLSRDTEKRRVLLTDSSTDSDGEPHKKKEKTADVEILCMERKHASKYFGIIPEVETDWKTRYFLVESSVISNWTLDTVILILNQQECKGDISFLLGQIQILPVDSVLKHFPRVTELSCMKPAETSNSHALNNNVCTLRWKCTSESNVQYYNIYTSASSQPSCLHGHTTLQMYVLDTDKTEQDMTVLIQPVTTMGVAVPLTKCSSCVLPPSK